MIIVRKQREKRETEMNSATSKNTAMTDAMIDAYLANGGKITKVATPKRDKSAEYNRGVTAK